MGHKQGRVGQSEHQIVAFCSVALMELARSVCCVLNAGMASGQGSMVARPCGLYRKGLTARSPRLPDSKHIPAVCRPWGLAWFRISSHCRAPLVDIAASTHRRNKHRSSGASCCASCWQPAACSLTSGGCLLARVAVGAPAFSLTHQTRALALNWLCCNACCGHQTCPDCKLLTPTPLSRQVHLCMVCSPHSCTSLRGHVQGAACSGDGGGSIWQATQPSCLRLVRCECASSERKTFSLCQQPRS